MNTQHLKAVHSVVKKYHALAVALILLVTVVVFVRFFVQHPQYLTALRHITLSTVLLLLGLNAVLLIVLVFIYDITLKLCGKRLAFKENLLLTSYSAIANFFGPLQSGPGVRTVYLKTKHQVRIRDYTVATLIYYAMFAGINAVLLFGVSLPWWQALGAFAFVVAISYIVIRLFLQRDKLKRTVSHLHITAGALGGLLITTFIQVCLLTACYFVELRVVNVHITLHQAIIYSGAANFALFVSLTPDAIGFRESFLVLSRRLHRISTSVIFAANVIDRAVYPLFLALLFLIMLSVHGRDRLNTWRVHPPKPTTSLK